jgi:hypothetical protein
VRHAAKLLEVKDKIVFGAAGVFERITLAQGWWDRGIYASVNAKGELS